MALDMDYFSDTIWIAWLGVEDWNSDNASVQDRGVEIEIEKYRTRDRLFRSVGWITTVMSHLDHQDHFR